MVKKIFSLLAGAILLAAFIVSCETETEGKTKNDDVLTDPVVELPPNVGVNPFAGKTFAEKYEKFYFSDKKTIMHYWRDDPITATQYRYSVNEDTKVLSWHIEKQAVFKLKLYSFSEMVEYFKSGNILKDYEDKLKKALDDGNITKEEFDEYLEKQKKIINEEIADGFSSLKNSFTRIHSYKYEYDEKNKTLDLIKIFDKENIFSGGFFHYNRDNISSSISGEKNNIQLYDLTLKKNKYFESKSFSTSDKKIDFVNREDESDTFTATYEFTGSGNDTKMVLSFTYNGQTFNLALDFSPSEIHLEEK